MGRRLFAFPAIASMIFASDLLQAGVYPPHSTVEGKRMDEWAGIWWQWAISVPKDRNPVADTTGQFAHEGQSGPVFFLAGTFGTSETRRISLSSRKKLLIPLYNWVAWNDQWVDGKPVYTCDVDVCPFVKDKVDHATKLVFTIDGVDVPNLQDYREKTSGCFFLTVPEDNVWDVVPGIYEPACADGYYLMIEPLSPGNHVIHAEGADPSFQSEITYFITVADFRRGDVDGDGLINITDPIAYLTWQFLGGEPIVCEDAADADDSGTLDLTDAVASLEVQFLGGDPLPPPGTEICGADPTLDEVACSTQSDC